MSKREYRRFTAEQKIEILREADQPGVTVSEVWRRHGSAPSVPYRWRAAAQGGSAVTLNRAVIAEITAASSVCQNVSGLLVGKPSGNHVVAAKREIWWRWLAPKWRVKDRVRRLDRSGR